MQRELCCSLWGLSWVWDSCKCYWINASLRDLCSKRVGLRGRICWSPNTHWSQSAPAELQRNLAVQVKMRETHCLTAAIPCWWIQIATVSWVNLALSTPGLWVPAYLMHFLLRVCVSEAFMWLFQYSLWDILCLPKCPGWGDWGLPIGCSEL